ncbi:MAG: hypothetical protein IJY03_04715 [Prevotella sp.]|jgi:dsDNA-specific endonuclease/ATPase MutS2|nr:hypothetical protein [Prevotella sp.]
MIYDEYKKLKVGDKCVIIKTGEPGTVLNINRDTSDIQLQAKRHGMGMTKDWYHYTYLAKI